MSMSDSAHRILVTGANGQVGWELMRRADKFGVTALGTDSKTLDITDSRAVAAMIQPGAFDVVVNAAAYTAVDKAESEPEKAYAVNRDGAAYLAQACAKAGIPLIHISTDYVFDGTKQSPYVEDDLINPINVYGASKAAGEQTIREHLEQHLILRASWVYGVHGNNFVKTMLRLAKERDELRVVADQWGCPTAAGDIAEVILGWIDRISVGEQITWGTYHFCGEGKTTWHEFAEAIITSAAEQAKCSAIPVWPIRTPDYPTPAVRPLNSVMACAKIQTVFAVAPRPWRVALLEVMHKVNCVLC